MSRAPLRPERECFRAKIGVPGHHHPVIKVGCNSYVAGGSPGNPVQILAPVAKAGASFVFEAQCVGVR